MCRLRQIHFLRKLAQSRLRHLSLDSQISSRNSILAVSFSIYSSTLSLSLTARLSTGLSIFLLSSSCLYNCISALFLDMPIHNPVCLYVCLCLIYLFISLTVSLVSPLCKLSLCLLIRLPFVYLFTTRSVYMFVSVCLTYLHTDLSDAIQSLV